jgi:hypothetical protein
MEPLTLEYLSSQIAEVDYFNPKPTLTHCVLTMQNGLYVTGQSACLNHARFDAAIGRAIAYQDALRQLWQPYGFIRAQQALLEDYAVGGTD